MRAHWFYWTALTSFLVAPLGINVAFAEHSGPYTYIDAPWVSGPMTYTQPGGPSFIGSYERDHFEEIYRTQSGYTFIVSGPSENPTYEYAELDPNGDFVGTGLLVGIDPAPVTSYMLERSGLAAEEIADKWHEFTDQMEESRGRHLDDYDEFDPIVKKVALILVEFPDRPHVEGFERINDDYLNFYWGQTAENIETMMNSEGIYHGRQDGSDPSDPRYNENTHPNQGEYAFRSFRDYWLEATYGYRQFDFKIVNDRDGAGEPEWLMMDEIRHLNNGQSIMESSCFWHDYSGQIPGGNFGETNNFKRDVFDRIERDHPWWFLDADDEQPGYQPYDEYLILYPGGPNDERRICTFSVLPGNAPGHPRCLSWPLMHVPDPSQTPNAAPFFTHIGTFVHEFGHLALDLGDLRGCGFSSLMAQGNNCGVDRRDNNPCRLGTTAEYSLDLFERLSHDNRGGIQRLNTNAENVLVSPPTNDGHTVYGLEKYEWDTDNCNQQYAFFIESRKVGLRTEAHLRTGIDDHMLREPYNNIPEFDYNEFTSENQLVVWRGGTAHEGSTGWQQIVRNEPSVVGRGKPASNGGQNFSFFWPGHLQTATQTTADLTPYSFPGIGTTCGAMLNITPNDNDGNVTFDFVADYRNWEGREHPIIIDHDEFVLGEYSFRDNVIVRGGADLYVHSTYSCSGNNCIDDETSYTGSQSGLNFANGAGLIIEEDGAIIGYPHVNNNHTYRESAIIHGDQTWGGIRVMSSDPRNILYAKIYGTNRSRPAVVVSGHLMLDYSELEYNDIALWALPFGTIDIRHSDVRLNNTGIISAAGSTILVTDCVIESQAECGAYFVGGWSSLVNTIVQTNGMVGSHHFPIGGIVTDLGHSLTMRCNTIERNSGPGIFVSQSNLTFAPSPTKSWGGNKIDQNQWLDGQIVLTDGSMRAENGFNQISDNSNPGRPLVYYEGEVGSNRIMNVDGNYWGYGEGHINDIRARLRPEDAFEIQSYESDFELCSQDNGANETDCELVWTSAQEHMVSLEFTQAAIDFGQIVESYPTCKFASWSANKLPIARLHAGAAPAAIRPELLDLAGSATEQTVRIALALSAAVLSGLDKDFETAYSEIDSLVLVAHGVDSLAIASSKAYLKFMESALDTGSYQDFAYQLDSLSMRLSELDQFRYHDFIYKPSVFHEPLGPIASFESSIVLTLDATCEDSVPIAMTRAIYRFLSSDTWHDTAMTQAVNDTTWSLTVSLDTMGGALEYRFLVVDDSGRYETWPETGGFPDSTIATTHFVSFEPRLTVPLTDTAYVYAPGVITDDIEISDGGVLYVLPAPVALDSYVIAIDSGVGISLLPSEGQIGKLVVAGTDSTVIRLECADSGDRWQGISNYGGTVVIDHAELREAVQPLYVYKDADYPTVRIKSALISDFGVPIEVGFVNADDADSSYFIDVIIENGDSTGMVINGGALDFTNVAIHECADDGLLLLQATNQVLNNVVITDNGRYGLATDESGESSARLINSRIAFNGDTLAEIKMFGTNSLDISASAGNIVKDSTGVLFECAEVNDFDAELGSNNFVLADSTGKYFNVASMSGPSYITGNTFYPESVNDSTFIDDYMKHDTLSKWVYSYLRADNLMDEVIEDPNGSIDFELKAYVQNYLGTVANDTITQVGFKYRVFPDSTNWTTLRQNTFETDSIYDWTVSVGDQGGLISYIWWAKDKHGRYITSPAGADTTTPDSGATHFLSFEMSDTLISGGDSVTIWAPTTLTHDLYVGVAGKLVIRPWPGASDHTVTLAEGVSLFAAVSSGNTRPRIYIEGTESMPITLDAVDDTTEWDQVNLYNGELRATYATFRSNLVAMESGPLGTNVLKLDHCTFESSQGYYYVTGTDVADSYIRNCVFRDLGMSWEMGPFLVFEGDIEITDSWFYNNRGPGMMLADAGATEISGCNVIANDQSGLLSYGLVSSMSISCSEFSYNGGDTVPEVYMWDGTFDFSDDAGNVFADKGGTLLEGPTMASFELDSGGNGFYLFDSTGHYIVTGDNTDTLDASGNLWYPFTPDTSIFQDYFDPDTSRYWDWASPTASLAECGVGGMSSMPGDGPIALIRPMASTYNVPSHGGTSKSANASKSVGKSFGSKSVNSVAYDEAVIAQKNRQYAEAKSKFASFIAQNPDHPKTEAALSRFMVSAKKSGQTEGLADFFARQEASSVNPRVKRAAKFLKLNAMVMDGRSQEALDAYDDIIRNPESRHDSITAAIGATRVLFNNRTSRMSTPYPENMPESFTDMCRRVMRLIASERRRTNPVLDENPVAPVVPTSYALYQNYPNPFNPSTDIRFDLPEAVRVELKIFNILGQEVVTLVDDVRAAGAYRILWDGKNAAGLSTASGVYVYQIKTPNFTDAKKMVLIR